MLFRLGGVEFGGRAGSLIVTGFDPGAPELRLNDSERPGRDGTMVGRDFRGSSTWAFDISTNRSDVLGAAESAGLLAAAWLPEERLQGNVTVPLSYELGGRWRRVYGRPGLFAGITGDVLAELGVGKVTADFRVTDPLHYAEAESRVILTIVPASSGGLVTPLVAPLSTVRSSEPRVGFVDNEGDAPTPLRATFYGPVVNPVVRAAAGWEIGLLGTIPYDRSITVDARAGTVAWNGGTPVAGMLTRRTRLSKALLPVGQSELSFDGADVTGSARVNLAWRDAHLSL